MINLRYKLKTRFLPGHSSSLWDVRQNYTHTLNACYLAFITIAIVNNFFPLLIVMFQNQYGLSLKKITLLITYNFSLQLAVDLLFSKFGNIFDYRKSMTAAHALATLGMMALACLPGCLTPVYPGLIASITLYSIGAGIMEVLTNPILESCPTRRKTAEMSLLHSFYSWGYVGMVLVATGFFYRFGVNNWRYAAAILSLIPLINFLYFQFVPINSAHRESSKSGSLHKNLTVWILAGLMLCAGATEQGIGQWASSWAETSLGVSKTIGDLAGPCGFAALMGLSCITYTALSSKLKLQHYMLCSGILCLLCYWTAALSTWTPLALAGCGVCGFAVGILWPGLYSIAAARCPSGGTPMFAFLAFGGALGGIIGPANVGAIASKFSNDLRFGLAFSSIFPIVLLIGLYWLFRKK